MANSRRYKQLLSRLKQLDVNFLPSERLNGNYTKKETDSIRSYVLLSHAEIESFLEDIVEFKAKKSLQKWSSGKKTSKCLMSIMAFHACKTTLNASGDVKYSIDYRINFFTRSFIRELSKNHGVKRDNILNLLLPIGIEFNDIDDTWLSTMNDFGSKRGEIAHSAVSIQVQIDPIIEKKRVMQDILPELSNIDIMVKKLS